MLPFPLAIVCPEPLWRGEPIPGCYLEPARLYGAPKASSKNHSLGSKVFGDRPRARTNDRRLFAPDLQRVLLTSSPSTRKIILIFLALHQEFDGLDEEVPCLTFRE